MESSNEIFLLSLTDLRIRNLESLVTSFISQNNVYQSQLDDLESRLSDVELILENGVNVTLTSGWNNIGVITEPGGTSVEAFFDDSLPLITSVYGFDNVAKTYSYWIQGLPPELQTLSNLDTGQGYWVQVDTRQELS